jgi:mannosyltransferase OCH1-like enzyme
MIPKKIHWCWLSGDPLPPTIQKCVNSWHKVMPDYEFVLWDMNKSASIIAAVPFVAQAIAAKKWACASDYIRWYALYTEGGIYLDSDVKVLKRYDNFLQNRAFVSEVCCAQPTTTGLRRKEFDLGVEHFGVEKGHPWMKRCLDVYEGIDFKMINGIVCTEAAPIIAAEMLKICGYNGKAQIKKPQFLDEGVVVYPEKYFTWICGVFSYGKTHSMHLCHGTWIDKKTTNLSFTEKLKRIHAKIMRDNWVFSRLHYLRKGYYKISTK